MTYIVLAFIALVVWLTGCVLLVERERAFRKREREWTDYRRALYALASPTSPRAFVWVEREDAAGRNSLRPIDGRPAAPSERSYGPLDGPASTTRSASVAAAADRVPLGAPR